MLAQSVQWNTAELELPEQRRTRSALRLIYVSPQFPCVSATFEQNELLGLKESGANFDIASCRPASTADRETCHAFCRPLLENVRYGSIGAFTKGLIWCLIKHPIVTFKLGGRAASAAIAHPVRTREHLAAFALAVTFAPLHGSVHPIGVHADFVQGSATVAWYLSELLGLPFTMMAHAFDIYSRKPGARESDQFFRRKGAAAAMIFVAHDFGRRWLVSMLPELASKLKVHRVTVRVSEFLPLAYPASATPLIVALGRLERKKGFDQLIRAMALLREKSNVTCEIHGTGTQAGELASLIKSLQVGDRVQLCGAYRQEELRNILEPASALVVPSVEDSDGDMDGIPTVIYEAMSFARPIIASAVSGIPEVIQPARTGLLVPPAQPAKLAVAIQYLLTDHERARRMGLAARAYVSENHDHLKQSQRLADLLCKAYQHPSHRAV